MFNNKTIFITGGTGSFGKEFIKNILKNYKPKKIIIYSRDELKQSEMRSENFITKIKNYNKIIRFFIGDIRDKERLLFAMNDDIDYVVHAAALKQVPTSEYNPFETIKTNIIGAQNVIDTALYYNIKKVIALSTDKASSPTNLYGATKLTSDKLFISANNYKGKSKTELSVVRYGNVLGSRGSIVPILLKQTKTGTISITDKRMTRFSITLNEGVQFVIKALSLMQGGEIFVPKIPSYNIETLAKAVAPKCKIKYTGIRTGEKIHEEMISIHESHKTLEFDKFYIIKPDSEFFVWNKSKLIKKAKNLRGKKCSSDFSYTSDNNSNFLSVNELKKLIKDNIH